MLFAFFFTTISLVSGLHQWNRSIHSGGRCVPPGQCTPPPAKYTLRIAGPAPGQQWNINGGFCGAWSTQQCSLSVGAWISQDLVRKANRDQQGIEHNMHGDRTEGYEVMPINVAYTGKHLKMKYDEWDSSQRTPQSTAYKKWLKSHLVQGHCIVWFPICKGDGHDCYQGSCPNGGQCDHVEPMFGIYSNHSLNDSTVYDDDWIVHASDQDYEPYYRPIASLEDDLQMMGNCRHAGSGFGKNEMYPCFDEKVTYGMAVTAIDVEGTLKVSLSVDITEEPNVRSGSRPKAIHGKVTVYGLTSGKKYTIYRYKSTADLPSKKPFGPSAESTHDFTASGASYTYSDPSTFMSNSATYYLAAEAV